MQMHLDEKELLQQIRDDPQLFALIYDNHYNAIFSYAFRRLANYDLARDITAECFLKAYQKINSFAWRNIPVSAWLFRIATNEINLYFRNSKKYIPACLSVHDLYQLAYEEGIETEKDAMQKVLDDAIEFSEIQKRLSNLDVKYQEVIALRFFEEKSLREIAAILNKKDGTIKSLLSRGLKKLKIAIENG